MVYQGSKNRLSKDLLPIIHSYIEKYNIDTYIELFGGGCNLIDKVQCKNRIACDANDELIALLQYAQRDNELSIAPSDCSFEHYADVRESRKQKDGRYSKEYIALIGYMASFGGRYFQGGYGRDSKGQRNVYKERLANFKRQIPMLNDVSIRCCDYKDFPVNEYRNALFYMDPPYANTQHYDNKIDYEEFYDFCRELSKTNFVLISEYSMPDDFTCIWSKERKVQQNSKRTSGDIAVEKLFTYKKEK